MQTHILPTHSEKKIKIESGFTAELLGRLGLFLAQMS